MRRFLALLLLALFGLAPVSPLLASNASLNLPSCRRRDGTHHCAMDSAEVQRPYPLQPRSRFRLTVFLSG
jgi:hypothetical protein